MKKRKVKIVLASLVAVLMVTGVFFASANTPPPEELTDFVNHTVTAAEVGEDGEVPSEPGTETEESGDGSTSEEPGNSQPETSQPETSQPEDTTSEPQPETPPSGDEEQISSPQTVTDPAQSGNDGNKPAGASEDGTTCNHPNVEYTNNGDGTHKKVCSNTDCGQVLADSESHTFQDGTCVCGATEDTGTTCKHENATYTDNEDGTHTMSCPDCTESFSPEKCTLDKEGICTVCGYKADNKPGTVEPHTHNNWSAWAYENKDSHSRKCQEPGCTVTEGEGHTLDKEGICTVCKAKVSGSTVIGGNTTLDVFDEELENKIKDTPEKEIEVTYGKTGAESVLEKGVLSAIQTTKKTIRLTDGKVEWLFNGTRITGETKSIKLDVEVASLEKTTSDNQGQISKLVKNTTTAVLSFKDNGVLPGPATISVSKDELFPNSKQTEFYVYYFNETKNLLEYITTANAANGYLNFDIFHNSDYIITDRLIRSSSSDTSSPSRPSSPSSGSGSSSYKGPIDQHFVGGGTPPPSVKENPRTGAY